jgi:hypothetical protein
MVHGLMFVHSSPCRYSHLLLLLAGNKRFRELVAAATASYNSAVSRLDKSIVVNAIVEEIKSAGGRFLRRDEETGDWHCKFVASWHGSPRYPGVTHESLCMPYRIAYMLLCIVLY